MLGVILAGGSGHRLWPLSRQRTPKQFNDLLRQGESLLQATVRAVAPLIAPADVWIVTTDATAHLARTQLPQVPPVQILAEPASRNTAPAIAWGLTHLDRQHQDQIVAILPSDHWYEDHMILCRALSQAALLAAEDHVVLLGAPPDHPHTGYGYIERGAPLPKTASPRAYTVHRFTEKPTRTQAQHLLDNGAPLWNCGIVVARVSVLCHALATHQPTLLQTAQMPELTTAIWADLPALSFDQAVLEQLSNIVVVPLETGWADLGSWEALDRIVAKDADANVVLGDHVVAVNSNHNIVCTNGRLVAMLGVEDLVIVDTPDALLVGHKNQMQSLRTIIAALEQTGHGEIT